jgi:membrane protease YdiL (CAAX protease family)
VLPPIVEETVFRGFIFTGLRGKLKFVWAAVLTSLLFATAHLEFGSGKPLLWVAGLDTFTLSLALCYLREKTGSLWPGILLHALKNGVAFLSLFVLAIH